MAFGPRAKVFSLTQTEKFFSDTDRKDFPDTDRKIFPTQTEKIFPTQTESFSNCTVETG